MRTSSGNYARSIYSPGTGIHPNHLPFVDKQGHPDFRPGLQGGGLGGVGGGVALEARIGGGHLQFHEVRGFHAEDLALIGHDLADHVLLDKAEVVRQDILADGQQLIGLAVHEIIQIAVVVGVFHILSLNESGGIFIVGVEGFFHHRTGDYVADFGAHESGALARLDVLEFDNLIDVAVHFKRHAVAKITC